MGMPHYVPEYFYLGDGFNKIDLMDVYKLADIAITLIPTYDEAVKGVIDEDKVNTCLNALKLYINNYIDCGNHDNEDINNSVKCYYLLNADLIGRELLFRTIHFKLWNKLLLSNGLSIEMIKAFNKAHDDLKMVEEIGTTINKEAIMRNYNDSNSNKK